MKKVILAVAAVVVVGAAAVGYTLVTRDESQPSTSNTQQAAVEQKPEVDVSYRGVEGKSALDLLKQSHKVETKNYEGLGELVTSINGKAADEKHFWAFYVNGQQSQVGASSYVTKDTDTIMWKLEKIQ